MSGMCKSDQWQNSRNKKRYELWRNQKTWETHKAKVARRIAHQEMKRQHRLAKRIKRGKPIRGTARARRRLHLQRQVA